MDDISILYLIVTGAAGIVLGMWVTRRNYNRDTRNRFESFLWQLHNRTPRHFKGHQAKIAAKATEYGWNKRIGVKEWRANKAATKAPSNNWLMKRLRASKLGLRLLERRNG